MPSYQSIIDDLRAELDHMQWRAEKAESECRTARRRLAQVHTLHVRASTDAGPDYCQTCSEAAAEWVTWPCRTVAFLEAHDE